MIVAYSFRFSSSRRYLRTASLTNSARVANPSSLCSISSSICLMSASGSRTPTYPSGYFVFRGMSICDMGVTVNKCFCDMFVTIFK